MNNFHIDILLSTYNGEKYLREQIHSILNQSYSVFRLLVRDDGSTDNTLKILDEFVELDNRVFLLSDDFGNIGLVKSLELLLFYSTGDFIMFSDQDDIWFKDKITIFVNAAANYDSLIPMLFYSDSYLYFNGSRNIKLNLNRLSHPKGLNKCLFNFFVQGASSMINRILKDIIIPFPTEVYVHDRYIHLMAELLGTVIYLPKPTMYYRQHEANLIGASNDFKISSIKNFFDRDFFIKEDRNLIISIYNKKFTDNLYLQAYTVLTNQNVNLFKKIEIILRYRISLRSVDFLRLLFIK